MFAVAAPIWTAQILVKEYMLLIKYLCRVSPATLVVI